VDLCVGQDFGLTTPSQAAARAQEGDTVLIQQGTYEDCATWPVSVTIRGFNGRPRIGNEICGRRAVWIVQGDETVIENVELFGGSGSVFSVGADISLFEEALDWTTDEFRANTRVLSGAFDAIEESETPAIAAIDGTCVGGGLELALWCDLRVASDGATFGCFERRFGVPLVDGATQRLPRIVGLGHALDLILTGRVI
jgi:1,4-dihydroxy-2-naphthoyl-CoA synthase